ncbi:protein translocase subunit SecA2, chloroplastic isoform X1 [Tanacetum coccineum]
MNRSLFTRIVRDLSANCPYFQEGCDAVGKASISALVKCTSTIRQLAYAAVPDSLDEYLQIGEKTSRDCLMHFCNGVIELYGEEYLRRPTRGDSGSEPFILLEAVASQDLWIWYAFFGVAGSNNDVNVLRQSPILNDLKVGKAPEVVLMKSISQPGSNDVKTSARSRSLKRITHLMYTCIILHNMIRKEKEKAISPDFYPEEQHREDDSVRIMQISQENGQKLDKHGHGIKKSAKEPGESKIDDDGVLDVSSLDSRCREPPGKASQPPGSSPAARLDGPGSLSILFLT